jgi:hypothetical protein
MRISSYPRQFADEVTVEIRTTADNDCVISLSNQAGKIMRMMGVSLKKGLNNVQVNDLQSLSSGSYLLEVKDLQGGFKYYSELVKQ